MYRTAYPICLTTLFLAVASAAPASGAAGGGNGVPDAPTFARDVAPIVFTNCVACHRPGEIAPFPLQSYEDVRKRAKQVADVVGDRQMPPWKPEPGHGRFVGEQRLTDGQVATIRRWVEQGAPAGDPKDLPPLPEFKDGWKLGEPDVVLTMPEPFTVPAEGQDVYMHFVLPIDLPAERYLRGVEVRPGNPRVAHHAVGLLDRSGTARRMDAAHPGPGYPGGFGRAGFIPSGVTPGYVPGQTPRFYPADAALTIQPGTDLVLQMHYHPTGKAESDRTVVGLYFTDRKPARSPSGVVLASEDIDIPAGAEAHKVTDEVTLPTDLEVTDVWAHMHHLGKEVRVWAETPDGGTVPLLKITDWDFNWQDVYRYEKTFRLPKGTVVRSEWVYDNSTRNPRNPNSPPRRVLHGEQSTDEMAGVVLAGLAYRWQDELLLLGSNLKHSVDVAAKGKKVALERERLRAGRAKAASKNALGLDPRGAAD